MQNKEEILNISHMLTADISIVNQFCHFWEEMRIGLRVAVIYLSW